MKSIIRLFYKVMTINSMQIRSDSHNVGILNQNELLFQEKEYP